MREVIDTITMLLTEAYAGPPNPNETWFVDNEPDAGILGLLAGIDAAQASRSVDGSGARGSTIAANVEHLRWSLANTNATIRGEPFNPNWSESWDLVHADTAAWEALRRSLKEEFETLRQAISAQQDLPGEYLPGVMALVPHAAFHLGTIRQMLERVKAA